MASKLRVVPVRRGQISSSPLAEIRRNVNPRLSRFMATEIQHPPDSQINTSSNNAALSASHTTIPSDHTIARPSLNVPVRKPSLYQPPANPFLKTAQCTIYDFPAMKPLRILEYPSSHLLLPIRKDILHRAVIYEGDKTRQGTASTKWRSEVHGSGRKLAPQKGTGRARVGDKKSPIRRGGGQAFGPKPRDFSTDLPRKVYDLAFRTALSHRFQEGELIVTESMAGLEEIEEGSRKTYMQKLLKWNDLRGTLFVTAKDLPALSNAVSIADKLSPGRTLPARAISKNTVDVKNLLEGRRIVIERIALDHLLRSHQRDLVPGLKI